MHTANAPKRLRQIAVINYLMQETQEDFYLVLFMFASQLHFYILGPSSLLDY